MKMFRPVGEREMELIQKSGFKKFPQRLKEQPFFYPVINKEYAVEIASKWNVNDINSNYKGYVLKFSVDDEYISSFQQHTVGAAYHKELWIPAEELDNFNSHIIGLIEIVEVFE